jgi:hypothetical protein
MPIVELLKSRGCLEDDVLIAERGYLFGSLAGDHFFSFSAGASKPEKPP